MSDIAICFATLSYIFQRIWTNLLTQCTQCQFMSADVCELQVYTHIYSGPKIPTIYIKTQRDGSLQSPEEGPEGAHPPPTQPPGAAPLLVAPGGRLGVWS